jgi:GNAT superfamily N-acetyltransferase
MPLNQNIEIRPFRRADVPVLLELMRELAVFENYGSEFTVTESDLRERGLCSQPDFEVLVAEDREVRGDLLGMAVYYKIPYTYDLTPDFVLKELYVAKGKRSDGIGRALVRQIIDIAKRTKCKRIKWLVMRDNDRAKQFYASLGAAHDPQWENWVLNLD